jgi:predicted dehydrogenase
LTPEDDSMSRLNVGVIGCGTIAQIKHLPHLRQLDDLFRVQALSDINPRVLAAVGDLYGVAARYRDYREMLGRERLDAVLIATSGSHAAPVLDCVAAGLPVFVEKPLAFTPREADEIVRAIETSGIPLMVGYMKRYDPAYAWAKARIAQIQDLRLVQVTVLHPAEDLYWTHHRLLRGPGELRPTAPTSEAAYLAATERDVSEGPVAHLIAESLGPEAPRDRRVAYLFLLESLCHDVNAVRGVLCEPEAVLGAEVWRRGLALTASLRFPADVIATFTWAYLPTLKRYLQEHAFVGADARIRLRYPPSYLLNTPTEVVVEQGAGEVAWEQRVTVSYLEPFAEELKQFHRCVTEGVPPLTSAEDARRDIHLLRAIALRAGAGLP